jgi:hypothetical protein
MSELALLAERARNARTVIVGLPIDALQRRVDDRRHLRRSVAGSVAVAVLAVVIFVSAVDAGRRNQPLTDSIDTRSVSSSSTSASTSASTSPPTLAPSSVASSNPTIAPAVTADPTTTVTASSSSTSAAPSQPAPAPPSAPAPPASVGAPAGLDLHGLSTDGIGAVPFGATISQVQAATGRQAVPFPAGVCEPATTRYIDAAPGFTLEFPDGGPLQLAQVQQAGVTTSSGVGVGTPIASVQKAVPNLERRTTPTDDTYWIAFSADHERSIAFFEDASTHTVSEMLAGVGDMATFSNQCN